MARRNDPQRLYPSRPIDSLGRETIQSVAWDMLSVWPTTAEWLAWVKRRDGRKTRWDSRRWGYPVRPMVARPLRKLP